MVAAALLLLLPAADVAMVDLQRLLVRLGAEGALSEQLTFLHTTFGTPARAAAVASIATLAFVFASSGRVSWLAHVRRLPRRCC
jgi:hypothetical protein